MPDPRLSPAAGFRLVALAFWLAMACSSAPTPLYPIYEARDGFGSATVTAIFAVYALGVIVSVVAAGHVSDWLGRRRTLVAALSLEAASTTLFALSPALPVLIAGRLLCGCAVGVVGATATAYLAELHAGARPAAGARRPKLVATAANLGGIGSGPLIAGALATFAPAPLRVPYVVFVVALALVATAVACGRETLAPPPAGTGRRYRLQRIAVPAHGRPRFFSALAGAFVALAVLSLFTSLAPSFLAQQLSQHSHLLAGCPAFLAFGAAASGQALLSSRGARRVLATGTVLLAVGIVLVVTAVWVVSLALFLLGGVVAGGGAGLLFEGSLATVADLAPAHARAEALAGLFLAAYLGVALPIVVLGVTTQLAGADVALLVFGGGMLAIVGLAGRSLIASAVPPPASR